MGKVVRIMQIFPASDIKISQLIATLNDGQTLVYPTETCYGLGCDATNQTAVDRIYDIKKREEGKPMIMLVPTVAMAKEYIVWSDGIEQFASKYWPGPVTLVADAKKESGLASGVISKDGTVAIRVTAHPFASALTAALGRPLVSTSANLAGGENPYDMETVEKTLGTGVVQPDIAIDAGVLPKTKPSTIVRVNGGILEVVRQGETKIE